MGESFNENRGRKFMSYLNNGFSERDWELQDRFKPYEAACLICNCDPRWSLLRDIFFGFSSSGSSMSDGHSSFRDYLGLSCPIN